MEWVAILPWLTIITIWYWLIFSTYLACYHRPFGILFFLKSGDCCCWREGTLRHVDYLLYTSCCQTNEWKAASVCSLNWRKKKEYPKRKKAKAMHFCSVMLTHTKTRPCCHRGSDVTDQTVQGGETQQRNNEHHQKWESRHWKDTDVYSATCSWETSDKQGVLFLFPPPKAHSCPCPWHTAILQDKNQQEHKPNLLPFTHQVHKPLFNSQHNEVRYQPLMYNKALEVMQNQKISPQKKLVVWNGVQSFYFGIRMAPAVKRDPCKKSSCSQSNCYARVHSRSEKVFVSALVLTAGAPCFPSITLHAFEMQKCFCIF